MAEEKKNDTETQKHDVNSEPEMEKGRAPEVGVKEAKAGNGIDLKSLRLSQDFGATLGVKKQVITVPVRKPGKQEFIRTHADPEFSLETAVIELKEEFSEIYLVDRSLWEELAGEITPLLLVSTITKQGVVFLWSLKLPGVDGRTNEWHRSALEAAKLAQTCWVRVSSNSGLGAYDLFTGPANIPEPVWPEITFDALIKVAFRDRFINTIDHPVVRRLRGEA